MTSTWFTKVKEIESQNGGTYAVVVSSITATLARPANDKRTKIEINNITAYVMYLGTYAATSSTNLYDLAAAAKFSDDQGPYTGAWYVLGQATGTIKIIEMSIE